MKNMFSAGELARLQNISKQTLLFYDKKGLFKPAYTDPENGYRYYSADQIDYLDTILIMKKLGFSLNEIKEHMKSYTTEDSLRFMKSQLKVIQNEITELRLVESRLKHRCLQVEDAMKNHSENPVVSKVKEISVLYYDVEEPFDMKEISVATKKCYARAMKDNLPVYYQCGVSVPLEKIRKGDFMSASTAFVTIEDSDLKENIKKLPAGLTVSSYHYGNYYNIESTYHRILSYCRENNLEIISDSYEFCINDYITSKYEDEFITKVMFYIE